MTIGLEQLRDEREVDRLHRMLIIPFRCPTGEYPLNDADEEK